MGGGGRRWIKKAVNVITLTLMAVDKDMGGGGAQWANSDREIIITSPYHRMTIKVVS